MDKLKRLLAEAEAALEARKKPPEDTGHRVVGEGLVIDEWVKKKKNRNTYFTMLLYSIFFFTFKILIGNSRIDFICFQKERREKYLARQQVEGVVDSV